MTLILSLLRHAKSSWDDAATGDRDRPLNERGRAAAPAMGAWMAAHDLCPDVVTCSTAARTRETLGLVLPHWTPRPDVRFDDALYLAEPEDIAALVRSTKREIGHLMIVGHNPGIAVLAGDLAGSGDKTALVRLAARFPTAGLAVIAFDAAGWGKIRRHQGRLVHFATPRSIA